MDPNGNEASSPLQRLLIGAATLIVVILTIVAAVFLARQDSQPPTPVAAQASPTTPAPPAPVSTSPPTQQAPTFTPSSTPTPPRQIEVTEEPTELPTPTATDPPTQVSIPPTSTGTPTEIVIVVTATPTPGAAQGNQSSGGVCQPPAGWVSYRVQVGDTLNSLASRTNTSVFELQDVNCLTRFDLNPNQQIFLPFDPPPSTARPTQPPTGTRLPTPTRTSTPVVPIIREAIVRIDEANSEIVVIVTGENFRSRERGFRAELVGPTTIELQLGAARTSSSFEAFAPSSALDLDDVYDLVVINPNGRLDTRSAVFPPSNATPTATPLPPRIDRITPDAERVSRDSRVTIEGRNFRPLESGFEVELIPRVGGTSRFYIVDQTDRPATSTIFDIFIPTGDLTSGFYDVRVVNPDGQSDTEVSGYEALP